MTEKQSGSFVWDLAKERINFEKHGIDFAMASKAFVDPKRKIYRDARHSADEERFFCIGRVGDEIVTVRFTFRGEKIRVIGAGRWRGGRRRYEKESD